MELFYSECHTRSPLIFFGIRPIKFFICDFVIPVAVVDAKSPHISDFAKLRRQLQ